MTENLDDPAPADECPGLPVLAVLISEALEG